MIYDPVQRAELGAKLLDMFVPGWEALVSANDLDMELCRSCVLAQIYGSYHSGEVRRNLGNIDMVANGFFIATTKFPVEDERLYSLLTDAWRAEIHKRQEPPVRSTEENHLAERERVPELT